MSARTVALIAKRQPSRQRPLTAIDVRADHLELAGQRRRPCRAQCPESRLDSIDGRNTLETA